MPIPSVADWRPRRVSSASSWIPRRTGTRRRRRATLAALDIAIRSRSASDAAFIEALGREAFAEYSLRSAGQTLAMSEAPAACTFVATRGRTPVGFAVLGVGRDGVAHLDAIAVGASWRGHGVGRRLLQHAESEARARGAGRMSLVTAQANLAALDLFLKEGFCVVTRLPRYYARGQDACRLEKRLADGGER